MPDDSFASFREASDVTPAEGMAAARMIEVHGNLIGLIEVEERLTALEERSTTASAPLGKRQNADGTIFHPFRIHFHPFIEAPDSRKSPACRDFRASTSENAV